MPAQEDWNREEHYEETLELIQQILPSLDTISRHFAEASEVMQRMNRRLAMAVSLRFPLHFLSYALFWGSYILCRLLIYIF